jgi:tetratricopeptide (TPR) repeat protein
MAATNTATGPKTLLGDRYEVLSALGSGSAANVFRVRDTRGGAEYAAKVLKPANAGNPEILARFEDEYRILKSMRHPHLPEVHDFGFTDEGGRYMVMDLVEGDALDAYFAARPQDIWVLLYELCETLTFIHAQNLLHQDIKPSNILVRRSRAFGRELPVITLIDFGLTYRRDAGASVKLVGTPAYVAPEVVRGEAPLTRAVDYYSLGVTLYELLCGAPPFAGTTGEVLRAHLEREPVIEEERLEWAELYPHVRALLGKDRRKRLEAFEELRRAVLSRLTGGIDELARAYESARASLRGASSAAAQARVIPGLQEAQELELAGETREALRAYLRLLSTCDKRDLESIEKICINAMRAAKGKRKYRLIGRYFLKRRVEALWARNMYIAAHRAIHDWAGGAVARVPSSLLPRYARGVMYQIGVPAARKLVVERLEREPARHEVTRAQLSIDLALFLYHSGDFSGAGDTLKVASCKRKNLTNSDQCRIALYEVMLMISSGEAQQGDHLAAEYFATATAIGCHDEALMLLWHRAYYAHQMADYARFWSLVREGLRTSHRLRLHVREAEFRALVKMAYFFREEYARAMRSELAAARLYQTVELYANAAYSWISIGMLCQGMGRFGDALRYFLRARRPVRRSHSELYRTKALLFELDLGLVLDTPGLTRSFASVEPKIVRDFQRGYFHLLRGQYELKRGRCAEARRSFRVARSAYESAGELDDVHRAAIMMLRADAVHGGSGPIGSELRQIEHQLAAVESVTVQAEFQLLVLELSYLHRASRERLLDAAARCQAILPQVADVPVRMRVLRQLARVYARLGDAEMLGQVVVEFQDRARVAVANMDSDDDVRRFLRNVGVSELVRMSECQARSNGARNTEGVTN